MSEIERALRTKIRQRIEDGRLPMLKPTRTWGGPGAGLGCEAYDLPISKDQLEYEVRFEPNPVGLVHMHLGCFAAWELERELIMRAASSHT
jgi:hypothetical protein